MNKNNGLLLTNSFALGLLGLFLPISETGKQCAIIIIIITTFVYILKEYKDITLDKVTLLLVSFLSISLVSIFLSKNFYDSIGVEYDFERFRHSFYSLIRVFFVYFCVRYFRYREELIEKFLLLIIFSYFISFIIGEYNVYFGYKKYLELKGVGHVNHSSIYSAIILFVSLNLTLHSSSKKIIYSIACVLSFFAVLQSGSRGTMLAVIVALVLHFVAERSFSKRNFLIAAALLVATGVAFLCNDYMMIKIDRGFHDPARIFIWKLTITEWLKHNIWIGIGTNNSYYINPLDHGIVLGNSWKNLGHSHNTFLTILLENGLIGLIAYIAFIFSILCKSFFSKNKLYCLMGFDVSVINLINSFFNTTYLSSSNELLMIIIWAIAMRFCVR